VLRKRVSEYFEKSKDSKYADLSMVVKTIFMLSLFILPILAIIIIPFQSAWILFGLYVLSGLGMAGIGMGVMHDANHGSYSRNSKVNKVLGLTLNLVGANANIWKLQHNVLHHSFTNIHEGDDDINTPSFLKFSPDRPNRKIHRYQHYYTWFFYALSTLSWITSKDFVRVKRYYQFGLIRSEKDYRRKVWNIILWKAIYFSYALILPIVLTGFSWWVVFLAFVSMHLVTGMAISTVFQIAHVMPDLEFPQTNKKGEIDSERMVHQMVTTTNFSPKNRILTWFIGGLNYQVEHHLFPNICHVHYRKLSPIVKETAREFDIPYNSEESFVGALINHTRMLKKLGRAA
jgi:linoleoyl-CoA desaturase